MMMYTMIFLMYLRFIKKCFFYNRWRNKIFLHQPYFMKNIEAFCALAPTYDPLNHVPIKCHDIEHYLIK